MAGLGRGLRYWGGKSKGPAIRAFWFVDLACFFAKHYNGRFWQLEVEVEVESRQKNNTGNESGVGTFIYMPPRAGGPPGAQVLFLKEGGVSG